MNEVVENFTVDFIIKQKNGNFFCKKPLTNQWRANHLYAYSFNTREEAKKYAGKSGVVIKRKCILEVT